MFSTEYFNIVLGMDALYLVITKLQCNMSVYIVICRVPNDYLDLTTIKTYQYMLSNKLITTLIWNIPCTIKISDDLNCHELSYFKFG